MPAPKGNQYGRRGAQWRKALERALARVGDDQGEMDKRQAMRYGLDKVANTVVAQAMEGNKDAWMEIANRLDGKPRQEIEFGENPDNPLPREIVVRIVRPEGHVIEGIGAEHPGEARAYLSQAEEA